MDQTQTSSKPKVPNADIRKTIVEIVHNSGAAHIGSALSCVEILNAIFKSVNLQKIKDRTIDRNRILLSKGHATAALYTVMYHHGLLSRDEIYSYSKNESLLAGHASHHVPFVEHSTGALGHGLPVALGVAIGLKTRKSDARVFVVVGDGELHEGSNWETFMLAGHLKMTNLCVLVDRNNLQQVGQVEATCSIESLKAKLESFNFNVFENDGHNEQEITEKIKNSQNSPQPVAIICRTTKGKGVSFMENNNLWHYRAPQGEDYEKALRELAL